MVVWGLAAATSRFHLDLQARDACHFPKRLVSVEFTLPELWVVCDVNLCLCCLSVWLLLFAVTNIELLMVVVVCGHGDFAAAAATNGGYGEEGCAVPFFVFLFHNYNNRLKRENI